MGEKKTGDGSEQFTLEALDDAEPLMPGEPAPVPAAPEPSQALAPPGPGWARIVRVPAPVCPDHGKRECLTFVDTAEDGASLYVCTKGA